MIPWLVDTQRLQGQTTGAMKSHLPYMQGGGRKRPPLNHAGEPSFGYAKRVVKQEVYQPHGSTRFDRSDVCGVFRGADDQFYTNRDG